MKRGIQPVRQAGHDRRGFVLPLVVLGILSLAFLIVFINGLGSSYFTQVAHEDETLRCRAISEAVLSQVLARIRHSPWKARFFSPRPYLETDVPLFGGSYQIYLVDAPGVEAQADLYVEARYGRAKRLYFWRIKHERSLLDSAGRMLPILFTSQPLGSFPTTPSGSPFAASVGGIVTERQKNQGKADAKAATIKTLSEVQDVVSVMNGPTAGIIPAADQVTLDPPDEPIAPPPASSPESVLFLETFSSYPLGGPAATFQTLEGNPDYPPTVEGYGSYKGLALYDPEDLVYCSLPLKYDQFRKITVEIKGIVLPFVSFTETMRIGLRAKPLSNAIYYYGFNMSKKGTSETDYAVFTLTAVYDLEKALADVTVSRKGGPTASLQDQKTLPRPINTPIALGFRGPSGIISRVSMTVPYLVVSRVEIRGQ